MIGYKHWRGNRFLKLLLILIFLIVTYISRSHHQVDSAPLFSVIIPVFNTGIYLSTSIESVLKQSIGHDLLQIILVNDGSTDNSSDICEKYQQQYPHIIVYLNLPHAGVSNARNQGYRAAQGRYITFLDSDDKWHPQSFSAVRSFFNAHREVDIVCGRLKFFESSNDYHILDYHFRSTKVVDLSLEPDYIISHTPTTFIRSKALKKHHFREDMKYNEDAQFINLILLENPKAGFIREAVYYYRKRYALNSATNRKLYDPDYYLRTPVLFYNTLIEASLTRYGYVLKFIQHTIMYDIQWRLLERRLDILSDKKREQYSSLLQDYISLIDDEIILAQRGLSYKVRRQCVYQKYTLKALQKSRLLLD